MRAGEEKERQREKNLYVSLCKIYDQPFCGGGGLLLKSGPNLVTTWT